MSGPSGSTVPGRSHNVLDPVAFDELDGCLAEIEGESSIRGVLIRSAKPAGFCAGADLQDDPGHVHRPPSSRPT